MLSDTGIGEVVEVDAEPVPIGKLPGQLDSRAKLDWVSQVFPVAGSVITGCESGSKEEMMAEEEVQVDSQISVEGTSCCCHQSHKRAELEISIGWC